MSESLGQQVIVENIGAAAGIVGTNRVAKAAPDGYTFLLGSVGTHAYNATLYKKLPYNPATDFAPVALFAEQPMVLITRKDFPANNLQEFIAYAKANGAKLQYGSAGVGSTTHLGCALLNAATGINTTHVPYRGGGPAMLDLIAGQVHYMCSNSASALPQIASNITKRHRPIGTQPFVATSVACNRARTRPSRFRSDHLERVFPAQGHPRCDRQEA
jgi:tripartite-type tricarboxylate transporter receptor subunit TctC